MKQEPAARMREMMRQRQEWAARLLDAAEELDPHDRALLRGVYQSGMSTADLAAAIGLQPRTVRHRIQRLAARINSPLFQHIIRHRRNWPPTRRAVAERVLLKGRAQRAVASELGLSLHRVRQECDRVRHAFEAAQEQQSDRFNQRCSLR